MRSNTIIALLSFAIGGVHAQQLPQLSQYQFNDYVINPAVAGSRPFFEIRSGHRYQWVGIQDAPRTFVLSASTPLAVNMGVGGYLFTDVVGPTRRTGFQLSYAYHLRLNDDLRLGMAMSGGLLQYQVDGSKVTFHDQGDPVLDDQVRGDLVPDAKFGMYLHHPKFWVGVTVPQLMRNDITWFNAQDETLSKLEDHYYASAGYRWALSEDLRIEPSILVKYVDPVPAKIDLTATIRYKDAIWLAGTYRTNDAISAMFGVAINKSFQFGYSYDVITTDLRNYSTGTHEVMLAVLIGKALRSPSPKPPASEGPPAAEPATTP